MSEKITELHGLVLDGLIAKLKGEGVTSTDYANAIKFLKDSPAVNPEEEARKKKLKEATEDLDLPFPIKEEGE